MADDARAAVSPWIAQWGGLLAPNASILDLAAGRGRHSLFFAERGHRGAAGGPARASVRAHPNIEALQADLEDGSPWPLGDRRFGAVVVTNYLHRPLMPALLQAIEPGGVLLYETFME